jgi:hypothetical protein
MSAKQSIIAAQLVGVLILGGAAGISLFRHDLSLPHYSVYVVLASLAFGLLGLLYLAGGKFADLYPDYNVIDLKAAQRSEPVDTSATASHRLSLGTVVIIAAGVMFFASLVVSVALNRK